MSTEPSPEQMQLVSTLRHIPNRESMNGFPQELLECKHWCYARPELRDNGKIDKVPFALGRRRDAGKSYLSFDEALRQAHADKEAIGVGVNLRGIPILCLDLDNVTDAQGNLNEKGHSTIIKGALALPNAYIERSISRTGLHVFIPYPIEKTKDLKYKINGMGECFHGGIQGRYVLITAIAYHPGTPTISTDVEQFLGTYFRQKTREAPILKLVKPAKSAEVWLNYLTEQHDNKSNELASLFFGDVETIEKIKAEGRRDGSDSGVDWYLAQGLIRLIGADLDMVKEVMLSSSLKREKWDREDYLDTTIEEASLSIKDIVNEYRSDAPNYDSTANVCLSIMGGLDGGADSIAEGFGMTDTANGKIFAAINGKDFVYCAPLGGWFSWTGTHWERDTDNAALKSTEVFRRIWIKAAAQLPQETKAQRAIVDGMVQKSRAMLSMNRRGAFLKAASLELPIGADKFDAGNSLLNCLNGTINLRTGELRAHMREDYISSVINTNYVPDAQCPMFLKFMSEISVNDKNWVDFIQTIIGYTATGAVLEEILFFLWGTGANGKSTLMKIFSSILGNYSTTAPEGFLMYSRNEKHLSETTMFLKGARLVVAKEVREGQRLSVATMKTIASSEPISARLMGKDLIVFKPSHTVWYSCNNKPILSNEDSAAWRRMLVIPFGATFSGEERDTELASKVIAQEAQGVLAWIVAGARKYFDTGIHAPERAKDASRQYRKEMDQLIKFLGDTYIDTGRDEKGDRVQAIVMYQEYCKWCLSHREQVRSLTAFSMMMAEKGRTSIKAGKGGYKWFYGWKSVFSGFVDDSDV